MIDNKTKNSIINFIRLSFRYSTQCKDILKLSVHPTIKGVRGGKRYQCNKCKGGFTLGEIQIDHIETVVPKNIKQKDMTIQEFAERLYCEISNLQVLCKDCHKIKTNEERKSR